MDHLYSFTYQGLIIKHFSSFKFIFSYQKIHFTLSNFFRKIQALAIHI